MTSDLKLLFNNSRLTIICGSTASGKTAAVLQILKSLDNKTINHLFITDEGERMFHLLKHSEYSYKYLFENNTKERLQYIEDNNFKAKSRIFNKSMDNVSIINIRDVSMNILEQLNNFMDQYDNIYIDSISDMPNINMFEFLIEIRKILSQHLNRKIFLTINTRRSSIDINNVPRDFLEKSDILINSSIKNKNLYICFIKNRYNALSDMEFNIKDIYSSM
jgi:nucleoside-triphosphatase THEP1